MKKLRHIAEAALLCFIFGLSRILPPLAASALGGVIGKTIGPHLPATKRARTNIKNALPDKTPAQINDIITGMWDNLGRVIFEYAHLETISKKYTQVENIDVLKQYTGKPALIFTAHLGNWEIAPTSVYTQHNINVSSIYRAPNNPYVDRLLLRTRSLNGAIKPIPKSKSGTKQLFDALKNGKHIGVLVDQKYNEGIAVPFMGIPAMTSPFFAQIAQKLDCPLIPIHLERVKSCHFKVTLLPPLETQGKSTEDIVKETHKYLEEWIQQRPAQWLWLHRRWSERAILELEKQKTKETPTIQNPQHAKEKDANNAG